MFEKIFLYILTDTPSGLCWVPRLTGNGYEKVSIHSGRDTTLTTSPGGWMEGELEFNRNPDDMGLFRAFSQAMKFIMDTASIIRQEYYGGSGVETPFTLVVFKYNDSPVAGEPTYKHYTSMQLDLGRSNDLLEEGFECNLMQGGVLQLLKAYDRTVIPIACDGSIRENIKVNLDGLLVEDKFTYQAANFKGNAELESQVYNIPLAFINNEGDNFGIIHSDQSFEQFPYVNPATITNYTATSPNYLFSSASPITVTVSGSLIIGKVNQYDTEIDLFFATSFGNQYNIVIGQDVVNTGVINFNEKINLSANEKLFLLAINVRDADEVGVNPIGFSVVSGSLYISFASKALPTRVWGITARDIFKLLLARICQLSSTTDQVFNYLTDSILLEENLNLVLVSGDALRASGDANYQKFFQPYQINTTTPGVNYAIFYGPVLKTSLQEFFQFCKVILFAARGNQNLPSQNETLFIEIMNYVLNPDSNQITTGEVASPKIAFAEELAFTDLEIGYGKQTFDQKAGKYEYNTLATYVSPLKSIPTKKLSLISPYYASSYIIEQLRSNIDKTSTTKNDNDNTVHTINSDQSISSLDYDKVSFVSPVPAFANPNNTNIRFANNRELQPISMDTVDGSYFSLNNDPSIFIFSYPAFSASKLLTFTVAGDLTGLPANVTLGTPADYIKIRLFINGTVVHTLTVTSTSALTSFSDAFTLTQVFNEGDVIYATAETSLNGATDDLAATLWIGAAGAYWNISGVNIPVNPGSVSQMIAMPNVVAPLVSSLPTVAYGFQYFRFNSLLVDPSFGLKVHIDTELQGAITESIVYNLYKNGLPIFTPILNATVVEGSQSIDSTIFTSVSMNIGDVFYILASTTILNAQITNISLTFTSTNIMVYGLKRKQYDSIYGIPCLLGRLPDGRLITTGSGAPYNIEDLTPARIARKHFPWFASIFYNQIGKALQFGSLTKNQYLSTILGNENIIERADLPIGSMGAPLFYPYFITDETNVPMTFNELLTGAANGHVNQLYGGVSLTGFPWNVKQKPALNEKQSWQLLMSPKTNPSILIDLDINGLNYTNMPANSIWSSFAQSIRCVPVDQTLNPLYRTPNPDLFLFSKTISGWLNQTGYSNPWQSGVDIPLQFIVTGLSPVVVRFYSEDGTLISTTSLTNIAAPGLSTTPDKTCWQGAIPTDTTTVGTPQVNATALLDIAGLAIPLDGTEYDINVDGGLIVATFKGSMDTTNTLIAANIRTAINGTSFSATGTGTQIIITMPVGYAGANGNVLSIEIQSPGTGSVSQSSSGGSPAVPGTVTPLDSGCYYYVVNAGGDVGAFAQSECIGLFEQDYSLRILRFDYSHSRDKGILWVGTGFKGISFVGGFDDNRDQPSYTAAFFVDQPQDIITLNGIAYTTKELWIGRENGGIPDYKIKHYNAVLLFDNVQCEQMGISLDQGATWEPVNPVKGNPMRYWKTKVRLTDNKQGITIGANGGILNGSLIVTLDAAAIGPNAANESGSDAPDIIEMEIFNP